MPPALTIPALTLGLGLSANAYFFFGNLCAADVGAVPVISTPEARKKHQLSIRKASQIFDDFYRTASVRFASASLITCVSYLTTAYLKRNEITSPHAKSLLTTAGLLAIFPLPWTIFVMMPTNKRIMAKASKDEGDTDQSTEEFSKDIHAWVGMNSVRILVLGTSYAIALYSTLLRQ